MSPSIRSSTIFLFFFLRVNVAICWNVEEVSETLDQFVDINLLRIPRDSEDRSSILMEYEFNTGAGNREDLILIDISLHEYIDSIITGSNWQYLDVNGTGCLFRTEKSTLYFYKFDFNNGIVDDPVSFDVGNTISTFKVINVHQKVDAIAVLCVESNTGTSLRWYRLVNGNYFQLFWSWPVQKHIKDIKFIQNEELNKLLLLNDDGIHSGVQYSSIDVYGFIIDFSTNIFHFWLCQTSFVPRAFDIQVCSIYETISLALQGVNNVLLYEYRNTTEESIFRELQIIKSYDLKNFVCFESGYLQFLAISGPEAGLFHFVDGEFQFSTESDSSFDISEISWVKNVRLDTYRDESLLLIQLKNSTVVALAWQGLSFKKIQLPNNILDQFDLSKITLIPKYGFVVDNKFVKFHTELKNVKHPIQYTTERLLILQSLLNDSLNHQERIINETKARLEKSYLKNPVITGFWNIDILNTTDAVISDNVIYNSVTIGTTNLTIKDLEFDGNDFSNKLKNLEQKLDEIDFNLMNAVNSDSTELRFDSDVEVFGDINVAGNLNVGNLNALFINDINVTSSFDSRDKYHATEVKKMFDSIEAENLTIHSLNGIAVGNIRFDDSIRDYRNVDLARINRARIKGHLSFAKVNDIDWKILMNDIVWKDKPKFVPGNTIVEGTLISDIFELVFVNNLFYPEDYVLNENEASVIVTGSKMFDSVLTSRLQNISTLNGVSFEEFVILNKDNVLKEEITFENLRIQREFKIDGEIMGLNLTENLLLNETSKISSDVSFINLNVLGNVTFDTLLVKKRLLNLGDLLLKTEKEIEISGTKTFLRNVEIKSNVTITSGMVNRHFINEYVTLDTEQTLPNLTKIMSNVTFGNATFGAVKKLEAFFERNKSPSNCIEKIIVFKSPITVDGFSFNKLNNDVPYERFTQKLNETFQNVTFENLITETLWAKEITAKAINGLGYANFTKNLPYSSIVNEYIIDRLETVRLNVTLINGMSLNEIDQLKERTNTILSNILNGSVTLESLRVTGMLKTNLINGNDLKDFYKEDEIGTAIYKEDVSIKNLTILGLMNGFNILDRVSDTVLKTDRNILITGYKTFNTINCHQLEATSLNGHPLENILDPFKEQTLLGPVILNGSMTVLKDFDTTGKIGDVAFYDLINRFKSLGNNTFEFNGDVRFSNNVTIKNLYPNGLIEGRDLNRFLNTTVFINENNLSISGTKVFQNSVTFNEMFIVLDKLNDIDLKRFQQKVVFIDKPFSVESKIIFKDSVEAKKDLVVRTNLETKSIMGIDVNDLQLNVLHLDRPTYVQGTVTIVDVNVQSDIEVEMFNDLDTKLLIPLRTEQTIPVEVLMCRNITVDKIQIFGRVNNENLKKIQENTFMLIGNQNITGHFNFHGHVLVRRNFNARLINGIDPMRFIPLNANSSMIGNFIFEEILSFNQSLRAFKYLNGINPTRWEAVAVTANNLIPQIISGRWTVFGNIFFEKGASGSDILNGTNITNVSNTLAKRHLEMDTVLTETSTNLDSMCEDFNYLKHSAEKQIYQFNVFDYLQIIEFNSSIISVHYFELDDLDYLMLSYNSCQMHTYVFTGTKFELVAIVPDFGVVERWTTFKHDHTLYFITSGASSCGRSPVNLWTLKNDEFEHVLDLGYNIDSKKINQDAFFMLLAGKEQMRSSGKLNEELEKSLSSVAGDDKMKIMLEEDQMLLTKEHTIYEYNVDRSNDTSLEKYIESPKILNFKAGLFEKEMFLYYDEEISKDRIFICDDVVKQKKILQTIKAHRPTSFTILHFEGTIETMLVFIENKNSLRIYEYKGIQGFVYKDSIRINVDKLFSFKIRKYTNLAKRYCLALIHDNKLIILEAKMHGEKLDVDTLTCSKH